MTIQLRQICLVATQLKPAIDDLTAILGIEACYIDPGVGAFGLQNTLMSIGRNFLEVVAPIRDNTAAGRYLERRQGDGGYMVITQSETLEELRAMRQRALDNGVRIAFENQHDDWHYCHLHPADMVASFLDIECDHIGDLHGNWPAAGGIGWEDKVRQEVTVDLLGAQLQSEDPESLAALWGRVLDRPVTHPGSVPSVALNNARLRFVEVRDARGPGLAGLDIAVRNRDRLLAAAKARDCYINDAQVVICGTHFYLHEQR